MDSSRTTPSTSRLCSLRSIGSSSRWRRRGPSPTGTGAAAGVRRSGRSPDIPLSWVFVTANVTSWPRCQSFLEKECQARVTFLQETKAKVGNAAQGSNTLAKVGWNARLAARDVTLSEGSSAGVGLAVRKGEGMGNGPIGAPTPFSRGFGAGRRLRPRGL